MTTKLGPFTTHFVERPKVRIRIVKRPEGPLEEKGDEWLGVEMVARRVPAEKIHEVNLATGEPQEPRGDVYEIPVRPALRALRRKQTPEAREAADILASYIPEDGRYPYLTFGLDEAEEIRVPKK